MTTFRILSLDGGGIMGAFTASVLATFERATGVERIGDYFELIAGTSTGGIIAIGLGMGKTAQEICDFFGTYGPKIFPPVGPMGYWLRTFGNIFRPKFSPLALRDAMEKVVGDETIDKSRSRLIIPAYDVDMGRIYMFKTPHHPKSPHDRNLRAADIALATSAAPTYFPAHTIPQRGTFIDGGIWANCPAMIGLVEAIDFLGKNPTEISLLSISTTSYPFKIRRRQQLGGLLGWSTKIIETFMFGQAQAAIVEAASLMRRGQFHRVDYITPPGVYSMDNARCVKELVSIGRGVGEMDVHLEFVKGHVLNGEKAEPFSPFALG